MSQRSHAPLSFAQQRLWFLSQLEPDASHYNMPKIYRLRGPLNIVALERSISEILRRHEILRTTYQMVDGEPRQFVTAHTDYSIPVINVDASNSAEQTSHLYHQVEMIVRSPFELHTDIPLRANLLRLGRDDHILVLVIHHIASDGWSGMLFNRELALLYATTCRDEPSPLQPLPIQYRDFVTWQRGEFSTERSEERVKYWRDQLADAPSILELPVDATGRDATNYVGGETATMLSPELTTALEHLSRSKRVTLFMLMLAALNVLLTRISGQSHVVVGSPFVNRNRVETEDLIGIFLNTLAFHVDCSGDPTFEELLTRVREVAFGAYDHQELPFEELVKEIQPERNLLHQPIFDVMLNYMADKKSTLRLAGLETQTEEFLAPQSKYAMTLYATKEQGSLALRLVYRRARFSAERMEHLLAQYVGLLEQIVVDASRPILDYQLITAASKAVLPDPAMSLPSPTQTLTSDAVMAWAMQSPEQIAIRQGNRTWSYLELATAADILTKALLGKGLASSDVVAIYGKTSFGLIAGALATLRSGGVLLFIDPGLPTERQRVMLTEAGARYLLDVAPGDAVDHWRHSWPASCRLTVNPATGDLTERQLNPDRVIAEVPVPDVSPEAPAYIFFTSGTTGTPKGILGSHQGLSHYLKWQRSAFQVSTTDRCAQLTALSFDVVLRAIFLPLTSGATLCIPETTDGMTSKETLRWLEQMEISILHVVPSLAAHWLANTSQRQTQSVLRWVFFAGEPLTENLVHRWRAHFRNGGNIVNLYGPTETTMVKCFYRIPAIVRPGIQPIGMAIDDSQALIINDRHQLCGIGEIGQIAIRTPFGTFGYINDPVANDQHFVQNPFTRSVNDRLYLTGDMGRYEPDGILTILGRTDHQVKIRGIRVEPAEVNATLAEQPGVQMCEVIATVNDAGEAILIAYVVPESDDVGIIENLRSRLKRILPIVMIPSTWVLLEKMPLMANGKVDRQALPRPSLTDDRANVTLVAPRTPLEKIIARIWADILKVEQIGVFDDYFELGGHSLMAIQIVARLRHEFGMDIPLMVIFEAPTIAELSERIFTMLHQANGSKP